MRARLAHTSGNLVRAFPDDAWISFNRFKFQQWLMEPRPDHKVNPQHKETFDANAHTLFHVRALSNFMCTNSLLNCVMGRTLVVSTEVCRGARVCAIIPRFRGVTRSRR
jgi:hypothetical protein